MPNAVPCDWMFNGLERAYDRLVAASDDEQAYHAIFEALNWLVSLDDRFGTETGDRGAWLNRATEGRRPDGTAAGTEALRGLRYVRNSVHHFWADAVYWTEGAEFPVRLDPGQPFGEWRWNADIPEPDNNRGRDQYRRTIVGQSVRLTIEHAAAIFGMNAHLIGCEKPAWIIEP